jgi:hypothetical protein
MRTFTLYLLFLIIAALILSFAFIPRPPQTLIVREPASTVVPVRKLTYNPWTTEDVTRLREPATTIRMEKPTYDLRDGMNF